MYVYTYACMYVCLYVCVYTTAVQNSWLAMDLAMITCGNTPVERATSYFIDFGRNDIFVEPHLKKATSSALHKALIQQICRSVCSNTRNKKKAEWWLITRYWLCIMPLHCLLHIVPLFIHARNALRWTVVDLGSLAAVLFFTQYAIEANLIRWKQCYNKKNC